jgi:hypothetical protein
VLTVVEWIERPGENFESLLDFLFPEQPHVRSYMPQWQVKPQPSPLLPVSQEISCLLDWPRNRRENAREPLPNLEISPAYSMILLVQVARKGFELSTKGLREHCSGDPPTRPYSNISKQRTRLSTAKVQLKPMYAIERVDVNQEAASAKYSLRRNRPWTGWTQ